MLESLKEMIEDPNTSEHNRQIAIAQIKKYNKDK